MENMKMVSCETYDEIKTAKHFLDMKYYFKTKYDSINTNLAWGYNKQIVDNNKCIFVRARDSCRNSIRGGILLYNKYDSINNIDINDLPEEFKKYYDSYKYFLNVYYVIEKEFPYGVIKILNNKTKEYELLKDSSFFANNISGMEPYEIQIPQEYFPFNIDKLLNYPTKPEDILE